MKPEDKKLLLKDLSARLPYNVKCYNSKYRSDLAEEIICITVNYNHPCIQLGTYLYKLEQVKPYLFPFSSMTDEEKEEYCQLQQRVIYNSKGVVNEDITKYINWCYKKHLDINNLIPMGLAIDATGLNLYKL